MKKVLYTDFEGVDNIISSMMDNPQLKKAVTRTNLMNFWDKILPQKFRENPDSPHLYHTPLAR